ncbi:MAG: molybdopterin-guanine dinucleotide biosynthesis protein B [Dehalococcoidales bacterium]
MPPVVSVVGRSASGKTTLIEKLLSELAGRGFRIATIKHTPDDVEFDEPGKDSWRHFEAGSQAAVISSPGRVLLIKPSLELARVAEVARLIGEDYDLVITEGFKRDNAPKIMVHRSELGSPPANLSKLIAVVSDKQESGGVRHFQTDDIKGIADLLEKGFIIPGKERVSLYINGIPVELSSFPRGFITRTLLGMVSSLKGVGKVESLDISLRRGEKGGEQ